MKNFELLSRGFVKYPKTLFCDAESIDEVIAFPWDVA
jgi:hypothetical protein